MYSYGKIARFHQSLLKSGIDQKTIEYILQDGETITQQKSTNAEKAQWLYEAMNRLDASLPQDLGREIREECACCLSGKRQTLCKQILRSQTNVHNRVLAANAASYVFGNGVREIEDGRYEVTFFPEERTEKRCPCVRDLDKKMPLTYCYCCGGHVKHHLQTALGIPLKVRVITSVLSSLGKDNCRFELISDPSR